MKKILYLAACAAMFATAAPAADMRQAARATAVVAPANDWSGLYLGVVGGWAKTHTPLLFNGVEIGEANTDGFTIGAQAGYDHKLGPVVLGLVGDWSYASLKRSATSGGVTADLQIDQLATVRAKLGVVPFDNVLIYLTGGGAYGHARASINGLGLSGDASDGRWGWAAGAGVSFALDRNWTAGVEYLRVDLGTADLPLFGLPTAAEVKADLVRGSVTYRF